MNSEMPSNGLHPQRGSLEAAEVAGRGLEQRKAGIMWSITGKEMFKQATVYDNLSGIRWINYNDLIGKQMKLY